MMMRSRRTLRSEIANFVTIYTTREDVGLERNIILTGEEDPESM